MAKERSIEGEGYNHSQLRHSFSTGNLSRCALTSTFPYNKEDIGLYIFVIYHNNPHII